MEGEEDGGLRLSKRIAKGEVDYSNKAGTAWSHSYLNQKPWHPLSYPNQKRKWIAEQIQSQKQRRAEEVAREFAQEQDFFRQTAAISKKEKEKVELMQAVSFMYARPPGYNAESAKAAEMADENKKHFSVLDDQKLNGLSNTGGDGFANTKESHIEEKKKPRPKDLYGRPIPTEEEFEVLKNAPRLETGIAVRAKPFGVEIRNVKCLRCGAFGHQSGDRECPMKDAIMPNEESRLKRDDPLTAMMACTESDEPSKWKLKQQPGGISPPRGGFKSDDPNQQIIPEEIFDEYGGFLNGEAAIPELLFNYHEKPSKTSRSRKDKSKHKSSRAAADHAYRKESTETDMKDNTKRNHKSRNKKRKKKHHRSPSSTPGSSDSDDYDDESTETDMKYNSKRNHKSRNKKRKKKHHRSLSSTSGGSDSDDYDDERKSKSRKQKRKRKRHHHHSFPSSPDSLDLDEDYGERRKKANTRKIKKKHTCSPSSTSCSSDSDN